MGTSCESSLCNERISKFYGECVGDTFDPYLTKGKKKSSPTVSKICLVCLCGKGYLKGEVITH